MLVWARAVETMPEILLAFSHGFGEMWHSDMISAFLPPFHANARIFRFDIVLKSSILSQCSSPEVAARSGRVAPENSPVLSTYIY